ncbi:MAG: polysaccharide biosynthesis tyrosine autokinase, partial [Leeuwenhoekiella sp.]
EDQLERKNLFATKTISFIDSSLTAKTLELQGVQDELDEFRDKNASVGISGDETSLITKITELDLQQQSVEQQLQYYKTLEKYLRTHEDYSVDLPAPSISGIGEGSITQSVSAIIELSEERNRLKYTAKPGNPVFNDVDRRIDAIKNVLLEYIFSSQEILRGRIADVRKDIAVAEQQMRKLPKGQQDLLNIQRRYSLSENTYGVFMAKRSEAGIIKAANVSDIMVIDSAKDTGGGAIGPNTSTNYIMAGIAGSVVPLVFVFLLVFFDNKIGNPDEIKSLSHIPILGTIGKSAIDSNLVVLNKPKSAVAEAFRGLRSSLQFIYRSKNVDGAKTVMVTSSVSGEGKTFCSINLATVFALSERKTILVGLDLRKPKIFSDFNLPDDIGVVNYLIGNKTLDEVVQATSIPHLDIILAGSVPPNPSELLMSDQMDAFMEELKSKYDYIILDTPPVGLVADSMELQTYADATLYILRQNFTNKGMLQLINDKYRKGEISNISFVLNCFRVKGKFGYGYGYGYGYGNYAKGYHEEEDSGLKNRIKKAFRKFGRK